MKISFSIPGKPARKERARFNRISGNVYTPDSTEEAEKAIAAEFRRARGPGRPWVGPIKLTVIGVFSIPPSWPKAVREEALTGRVWHITRGDADLDNMIKLVSDALNKIAFVDDAQIAVLTCAKRFGVPERTEITIEALPQSEAAITPGQKALEKRIAANGWDAVLAPPPKKKKSPKTESAGSAPRRNGFGRRSSVLRAYRGFPRTGGEG